MKMTSANGIPSNEFNEFSSDWLNVIEAAIFLRIFRKDGTPCVERIRNLVNLGKIPFYKPYGRLLFKKSELNLLIESSRKGGFKWR